MFNSTLSRISDTKARLANPGYFDVTAEEMAEQKKQRYYTAMEAFDARMEEWFATHPEERPSRRVMMETWDRLPDVLGEPINVLRWHTTPQWAVEHTQAEAVIFVGRSHDRAWTEMMRQYYDLGVHVFLATDSFRYGEELVDTKVTVCSNHRCLPKDDCDPVEAVFGAKRMLEKLFPRQEFTTESEKAKVVVVSEFPLLATLILGALPQVDLYFQESDYRRKYSGQDIDRLVAATYFVIYEQKYGMFERLGWGESKEIEIPFEELDYLLKHRQSPEFAKVCNDFGYLFYMGDIIDKMGLSYFKIIARQEESLRHKQRKLRDIYEEF
ncbi:MAG: hypothetical protein IJ184_05075 [Alphaproteobacteria bacterium]|nr:hypothetical protein [Alphaproteobacteria bacterium]